MDANILVVDDEPEIADLVEVYLKNEGYTVHKFGRAGDALACVASTPLDLAILDVMLPGKDGITLLKEARAKGCRVPVLMLTAKSEVEDKVAGLESGADYYLTKPFDKQELLAVIKTVVRRKGEILPDCLAYGDLTLNQSTYCLSGPEKRIQLGKKEYDVMWILMSNKEMVVSKEMLLTKIWGAGSDAVENNVEIYISFLRKKLDFLKTNVTIVTMRNFGYRLTLKQEAV